jgi:hypothetical protein
MVHLSEGAQDFARATLNFTMRKTHCPAPFLAGMYVRSGRKPAKSLSLARPLGQKEDHEP